MKDEEFEKYMEKYKTKSLKEKQSILIDQAKFLSVFSTDMCKNIGIHNDVLINREMKDIIKEDYTEDDFAEAMLVYINSIQKSLIDFADKTDDILSKTFK